MSGYSNVSGKDSVKNSNEQIFRKYFCVSKIFTNFAAEMVALPSKSGGIKEHQKGTR